MGPLQHGGDRGAEAELSVDERVVRPPVSREVDEELRFHMEMRVRELMATGMDEEEAREAAVRRLGDVERLKARMRREARRRNVGMRRRIWWDEFGQDVRFAWRQLRRAPSFTLVAVVTLALAIGANTAVFSVVNGVLLRPLPYRQADDLVQIFTRYLPPSGFDIPKFAISGPEFLDYQESTRALAGLGVYQPGGSRALTGDDRDAERISVTFMGDEVFPILGVQPVLGRTFTAEEDVPGGPDVVVLGYDLWNTRYGADSTLVGRTILMNGVPTEVIGVMPPGFRFTNTAQAYLPQGLDRSSEGGRGTHSYAGVGRLATGMTLADVDAELEAIKERWAGEYEHNVAHFPWAQSLEENFMGDAPRTLLLLVSAVALVLLVACANVANLLLARGERRQGEVAVRAALGAGRGRIVRQLATESLLLAGIAAAMGVGIARLATPALVNLAPSALPRLEQVTLDGSVLLFAVGTALVTALLFGVAPALLSGQAANARVASASARTVGGRTSARFRRVLVGGEVALCLVVVLLAGLLVRSYVALDGTDRGLDTSNLLTFSITLPESAYPDDQMAPLEFANLLERIRATPGVAAASASTTLPFGGGYTQWDFVLDDRPPRQAGDLAWNAGVAFVAPDFFETLGIPLLAGRGIGRNDDAGAPLVGVVSETFARTYWPGESPVGKRWGYQRGEDEFTSITVVGVARDQVTIALDREPYPFVWIPEAQAALATYYWPRTMTIAVRTGVDPTSLATGVRAAVADFDPDLPLYQLRTMDDAVANLMAGPRMATSLLGSFALLALLLAAVGIYGVIAYSVAGRTREIGVRIALGASRGEVMAMVLREGAAPVVVGVFVGLGGAWAATRLVESMLFGVESTDAATFTTVPLVLLTIGVLSSWFPAVRATNIPPTEALRDE